MQLKDKIEILVILVVIGFVALAYGVQRYVVYQSFIELENIEAQKDAERCVEAIYREGIHLQYLVVDWSVWDESYQFLLDGNEAFIESNLAIEAFAAARVDLIYFVNNAGKVVWGNIYDMETLDPISLDAFPKEAFPSDSPLLAHERDEHGVHGIVLTERGPMVVASGLALTSRFEGPPNGTVVMGRFLDRELQDQLIEQTKVDFDIWSVEEGGLSEELQAILQKIPGDGSYLSPHNNQLKVYKTIQDLSGNVVLLICAHVPRDISMRGHTAMMTALGTLVAAGILLLLLLRGFLQRTVAHPLMDLAMRITSIGQDADLSMRISLQSNDEIGQLSREFNGMLQRLEQNSQEQERLSNELERLSQQDGLTGLANRRHFDTVMDKEWRSGIRPALPLSLLMMDVDHFKTYNDTYGHLQGDEALRKVAKAILDSIRRVDDVAARYGGEEFAVILPNTTPEGALCIAERIRLAIERLQIPHEKSSAAEVLTVSIGVATSIPPRGVSVTDVIKQADTGLYHAKEMGRNQVVFHQ